MPHAPSMSVRSQSFLLLRAESQNQLWFSQHRTAHMLSQNTTCANIFVLLLLLVRQGRVTRQIILKLNPHP